MPVTPELGVSVMAGSAVTVNVAVLLTAPLAARTVAAPVPDAVGAAKVAENAPADVVVTVAGVVVTDVPLKVIATVAPAG